MKTLTIENIKSDKTLMEHGVYRIYLFNESPLKIQRFLKTDDSGLIYIGAAEKTELVYRLSCFLNTIKNNKQNNHSAGFKVKTNKNLNSFITNNTLMYDVIIDLNAKKIEKNLIEKYKLEFGEVPPLNG
jgi:DNA gyrase/topoisomerase IV subunit B